MMMMHDAVIQERERIDVLGKLTRLPGRKVEFKIKCWGDFLNPVKEKEHKRVMDCVKCGLQVLVGPCSRILEKVRRKRGDSNWKIGYLKWWLWNSQRY